MIRVVALGGAALARADSIQPRCYSASAAQNRVECLSNADGLGRRSYQVGYAVAVLFVLPLTDRTATVLVIAAGPALSAAAFLPFGVFVHEVWSASALRMAAAGLATVYLHECVLSLPQCLRAAASRLPVRTGRCRVQVPMLDLFELKRYRRASGEDEAGGKHVGKNRIGCGRRAAVLYLVRVREGCAGEGRARTGRKLFIEPRARG